MREIEGGTKDKAKSDAERKRENNSTREALRGKSERQSRRQRVMKGDVSERAREKLHGRAIGEGGRERENESEGNRREREKDTEREKGKEIGSPTRTEIGSKP